MISARRFGIYQGRSTSAARVRRHLEPLNGRPAPEDGDSGGGDHRGPGFYRPGSSLLAMPGWRPGPSAQGMLSFANEEVRLLKLENHLVREDHLDKRWEGATGESVDGANFLSRHVAVSNRPALTIHPIGPPHLREDEVLLAGGRPGWAAPPNPRIGPWLRLLNNIAESHSLVPEFEGEKLLMLCRCLLDSVALEATHHGPEISSPAMFIEIGSTEDYWERQDAAQAIALLVWEGLGLGGGNSVGDWSRKDDRPKVLLGIGGGHYVPRHMDIVRSFKTWRRKAVTEFLESEEIKIGKPGDFY